MEPKERRLREIFFPFAHGEAERVRSEAVRFVHYTTAEVALSIIQHRSVWMRNAMTMNDFSEIQHGINCLMPAYKSPLIGGRLFAFLDAFRVGLGAHIDDIFRSWLPQFQQNTYLTCLSEHDPREDQHGRLSMWRAYGGVSGVALVLMNTPFVSEAGKLKAYSSAVAYLDPDEFAQKFSEVVDAIIEARDVLSELDPEEIIAWVFAMLRFAVICTKHPGFKEEREWRIIYSPTLEPSPIISPSYECVRGIPQEVYRIPLRHEPSGGLLHADIPSLFERVIIGPSTQPITVAKTFAALLSEAKALNTQVTVSSIPLRAY